MRHKSSCPGEQRFFRWKGKDFRNKPVIYEANITLPPEAESPFDSNICHVAKTPEDF